MKNNGLSIAGFTVSLCSLLLNFFGIVGLVGFVLSVCGLAKANDEEDKKGLAVAGISIGAFSMLYAFIQILTLV